MTRRERTEILIKGSPAVAQKLAADILKQYRIKNLEQENNGLVMLKMREKAKQSLFYLGEVLVTECKVMINDRVGIGMVKGYESELAYNLAVIDAAYNAGLPETEEWTEVLLLEKERIEREFLACQNKILKTKVNFDTMDV